MALKKVCLEGNCLICCCLFLSRLSLDDKIYERELELALEMSRSESSQETSKDNKTVVEEGDSVCEGAENKENVKVVKRTVVEEVVVKEPAESRVVCDGKKIQQSGFGEVEKVPTKSFGNLPLRQKCIHLKRRSKFATVHQSLN